MLPRPAGRLWRRVRRSRLVISATALAVVCVGFAGPAGAGTDVWTPSNWTGPVAGPPVPGTGLPPAASPAARQLPEGYDVAPTYEGQAQCDPQAKPGTQALADLIKATYGANQTVWIPRACNIGGQSEHKEGRALDWMTSARDAQQRANAEAFLAWLLGPDQYGHPYGNAMRLGVMYIGWNDRIWRGYDIERGWTELKGCFATPSAGSDTTCHRNHIHISLTWDGASGRSSFWDGTPMDAPYCAAAHTAATTPGGGRAGEVVAIAPVRVLNTRTAQGVPTRCRLQQDISSSSSHRIYAKVTGQGGVPANGVAAVEVQVTAMGSNAQSSVRIWSPGASKSDVVDKVPMNQDAVGTATVPVASDGTIALATSAGATDVAVDVVGYYGPGDQPNTTVAKPGAASPMADEPPGAAPVAPPVIKPDKPGKGGKGGKPDTVVAPGESKDPGVDEFISIGAELGYQSDQQGPLQPGEARSVGLASVPPAATSALVLFTTRDATKRGKLRIGIPEDRTTTATFAYPKKGTRSAVLVVPVRAGQTTVEAAAKSAVHVRLDVLGYSINGRKVDVRGVAETRISKAKLAAGEVLALGPLTGVAGLPVKAKKVTGVILKVRTRTKDPQGGTLLAYGLDQPVPSTRSAPIDTKKWHTSLLVAELGTDGKIVISPTVKSKAVVSIVGYVHRTKA